MSASETVTGTGLSPLAMRALVVPAAVIVVCLVAASTAFVATMRYEQRNKGRLISNGGAASGQTGGGNYGAGDQGVAGNQAGPAAAAGPVSGGSTGSAGVAASAGGSSGATGQGGGAAQRGGAANTGSTQGCTDANPDQGIFCDHITSGWTTVLSGPLAPYGEAGIKAGEAWLSYFNNEFAPQQQIRKIRMVYYDDSDDPNKTLQFTQRMVEVDHVTYIGGVTSPGGIKDYLEAKQVPFIGDIGLSPLSYKSPMIYPVAPAEVDRNPITVFQAKKYSGATHFFVSRESCPGWTQAR
jgi:hypothetical protein